MLLWVPEAFHTRFSVSIEDCERMRPSAAEASQAARKKPLVPKVELFLQK